MAYCEYGDLKGQADETQLIQLTDDPALGSLGEDATAQAITAACNLIDGYLGDHYIVPVSPVPALVKDLAVDIALYNLFSRRAGAMNDVCKDRYAAALKVLHDIQRGDVVIAAPVAPAAAVGDMPAYRAERPVYGPDRPQGY